MRIPQQDWIYELYMKEQSGSFYYENGKLVMTEQYHYSRGYCCGNGCKHCPYNHKNVKK